MCSLGNERGSGIGLLVLVYLEASNAGHVKQRERLTMGTNHRKRFTASEGATETDDGDSMWIFMKFSMNFFITSINRLRQWRRPFS